MPCCRLLFYSNTIIPHRAQYVNVYKMHKTRRRLLCNPTNYTSTY
uniref:Uncharacterized protein n=1 Tax=Ackermannviridae sp. TaxID=2831612 RepID=A0A8S5RUK6_9CAUD|nr:MAG TPA: hypothetical protein [Ackermannviridae sp.]